jgi:hypothetical protein
VAASGDTQGIADIGDSCDGPHALAHGGTAALRVDLAVQDHDTVLRAQMQMTASVGLVGEQALGDGIE